MDNFNNIINKQYIPFKGTQISEDKDLLMYFKLHGEKNFKIIEIYSTNVYPEVLTYHSNIYLVWDMCFWSIFQHYLLNLHIHRYANANNNNKLKSFAVCEQKSNLYYFLSLKLYEYSHLSFVLAKDYYIYLTEQRKKIIQWDGNASDMLLFRDEHLLVSKMYCFFHENQHINYKRCSKRYNEDLSSANDILQHVIKFVSLFPDEDWPYPISKSDFKENIIKCLPMKKLKEEILCDTYAFNSTIKHFINLWKEKYDIDVIISKVLRGILIFKKFIGDTSILYRSMEQHYLFFRKRISSEIYRTNMNNINTLSVNRNYTQEIISYMNFSLLYENHNANFNADEVVFSDNDINCGSLFSDMISADSLANVFLNINMLLDLNKSEKEINLCRDQMIHWE